MESYFGVMLSVKIAIKGILCLIRRRFEIIGNDFNCFALEQNMNCCYGFWQSENCYDVSYS